MTRKYTKRLRHSRKHIRTRAIKSKRHSGGMSRANKHVQDYSTLVANFQMLFNKFKETYDVDPLPALTDTIVQNYIREHDMLRRVNNQCIAEWSYLTPAEQAYVNAQEDHTNHAMRVAEYHRINGRWAPSIHAAQRV